MENFSPDRLNSAKLSTSENRALLWEVLGNLIIGSGTRKAAELLKTPYHGCTFTQVWAQSMYPLQCTKCGQYRAISLVTSLKICYPDYCARKVFKLSQQKGHLVTLTICGWVYPSVQRGQLESLSLFLSLHPRTVFSCTPLSQYIINSWKLGEPPPMGEYPEHIC